MDSDAKKKGRLAALQLVNKLKKEPEAVEPPETPEPLDLGPLIASVKALANNHVDLSPLIEVIKESKPDSLDLSSLVKAVSNIELETSLDLSPIVEKLEELAEKPQADFKPVISKLDEIKVAMDENTKVLSDLVAVAKMSKTVSYDNSGRIIKIGVE